MAELVISPVLQVVLDKLATVLEPLIGSIFSVADNIGKLREAFNRVQEELQYAEEQLASDSAAQNRASRLKDLAYEALYLLLDCEMQHPLRFSDMTNAEKIRSMLSELEGAVDELLRTLKRNRIPDSVFRRETSYPVKETEVHGREQDKETIVKLLLSDSSEVANSTQDQDVPCVIIEGMTAIGKTTLAQLAFNDQEVTQHFDVKVWVFVSHNFEAKKILTSVVESVENKSCSLSTLAALHLAVEKSLKDKRYLIVLDDVWTDQKKDWDELRPLLGGSTAKYGSRILITTQNKRVALRRNVKQHLRHSLTGLSEDHCWSLFKQLAFLPGEENLYQNLWLIGQQIAKKCGGVPLAAKSLGSLLRFNRDQRAWLDIQDNELWNSDEAESGILTALRLSYSRLLPELRRCFAFCSIFPRGYEIKKEKLIHLWMAEGLITGHRAEKSGSGYFNDLLCMYFLEEEKQCDDGVVVGYKMHDAIYNLARFVAKSDYTIIGHDVSAPRNFEKVRHSSIVCRFDSPTIPDELYEAKGLLTLLLFSGGNFLTVPETLFLTFQ